VNSQQLGQPDDFYELSQPDFLDLREQSRTLEGFTATQSRTMIFSGGEMPERVLGASITVEGFGMLGIKPIRGRHFTAADGEPGADPVAILSHALWQRSYGGSDDVIGRVETINGSRVTIVGVMPPGFAFPANQEMWTPYLHEHKPTERGSHYLPGWARLRPGATIDDARAELAAIAARLAQAHPTSNDGKTFAVRPVRDEAVQDSGQHLQLMLGAAIFVLLIACANVANLLLAKAAGRHHEIAIRVSLGATRGRVIRQVLTESLALGLIGGAFGLLVAVWANSLILAAIPDAILPFWMKFEFDWTVFAFAAVAALGSTLFFGMFPALQASRNTATELKEGARSVTGSLRTRTLRQGLVVAQVALSAVLLIGAGLFVRSFLKLQSTPPGYDPNGVISFRVGMPPTQFTDKEEIRRFFSELTPRLEEVPGVIAVGSTAMLPGDGNNSNLVLIEGHAVPRNSQEAIKATSHAVSRGYFSAMRIPLLRGRLFTADDTRDTTPVVVIDQRFAERLFPGEEPISRRLTLDVFGNDEGGPVWHTIVGVVGNVPQRLDRAYDRGGLYRAYDQLDYNFVSYAARVQGDPATYGPALQAAVLKVRSDIPIYNVQTMQRLYDNTYWHWKFFGQVFSAFGLGALFLSALGVYGVMAYSVTQRTPEIGVRMALGASERDVLRLVGGQGLMLVTIGLTLGLIAALGLTRFMAVLLFGVSPSDPPTYFTLTTVLALVGLLACWLPARRAARINPLDAIRHE
jgi:putative ABC transport system permease protein